MKTSMIDKEIRCCWPFQTKLKGVECHGFVVEKQTVDGDRYVAIQFIPDTIETYAEMNGHYESKEYWDRSDYCKVLDLWDEIADIYDWCLRAYFPLSEGSAKMLGCFKKYMETSSIVDSGYIKSLTRGLVESIKGVHRRWLGDNVLRDIERVATYMLRDYCRKNYGFENF